MFGQAKPRCWPRGDAEIVLTRIIARLSFPPSERLEFDTGIILMPKLTLRASVYPELLKGIRGFRGANPARASLAGACALAMTITPIHEQIFLTVPQCN